MKALMEGQDRTLTLVDNAQRGDSRSFGLLVEEFRDRLRVAVESWSRFQVGPRVDVEDVLQDTFVRAFRSISRFEWQGEDSFLRWLCGIAKRALAQAIQEGRKEIAADPTRDAESDPTQSKALRRAERFDRLEEAIQDLKPEYRQAILLSRVEGLKTKEVAERMSRSANAVKHLIARALSELKTKFGDTESLHLPKSRQLGRSEDDAD